MSYEGVSRETKPLWWEWVVVGILLATAFVYARPAPAVTESIRRFQLAEDTSALARIYMAHGDYDKAQKLVNKAMDAVATQENADEQRSSCLIDLAWIYKNQGRFSRGRKDLPARSAITAAIIL